MTLTTDQMQARLDEMADARISALTTQARRDAAMALLESQGSATTEEIDEHLATSFFPPARADLVDSMARKASAGAEQSDRDVAAAQDALEAAHGKADRLRADAEQAQGIIEAAEQGLADARGAATDAHQLADYAASLGDPGNDAPTQTDAAAGPAGARVQGGEPR